MVLESLGYLPPRLPRGAGCGSSLLLGKWLAIYKVERHKKESERAGERVVGMANCSCLFCHLISEVICHCFQRFLLITYPSLVLCGREPCKDVVSSLVYFCCCCNKIFEGRSIILKKNRFNFAHSPGSSNGVALAFAWLPVMALW